MTSYLRLQEQFSDRCSDMLKANEAVQKLGFEVDLVNNHYAFYSKIISSDPLILYLLRNSGIRKTRGFHLNHVLDSVWNPRSKNISRRPVTVCMLTAWCIPTAAGLSYSV